jgi:hypothetical protein
LHRTEFVTEEFLLVDSGTALFEENRASRLDFDEHGKDWDEPESNPKMMISENTMSKTRLKALVTGSCSIVLRNDNTGNIS